MYLRKIPYLLRLLYKQSIIWDFSFTNNEIFLTFDDGPHPDTTPEILSTLEKFNIKATFFCIGKNVEKYPELLSLIVKDGHSIGNHTYSHINGWKTDCNSYINDVEKTDEFVSSTLFRPPYGKISPNQIKRLRSKYKIILWDVISGDFDANLSKEKCLDGVLKNTVKGSIVVFHDSLKAQENARYVLPRFIESKLNQGFNFSSINNFKL